MYEEILPGLYRIEIPLPRNPLQALNSYLIKGEDRFLIIDTGMNRKECQDAMFSSLKSLGVDLNRTDFFLTHVHVDHTGLAPMLVTGTSKVYFNETETAMLKTVGNREDYYKVTYLSHGFPREGFEEATAAHPGRRYGSKRNFEFSVVKEGDNINMGDYSFQCLSTPGHSPGHMCLYEANKKILVSGDHILTDITPNIGCWWTLENPLKEYLASLEKVYPLDVALVLPGHRRIMDNHRKRIRELQEHHQFRLNEVLSAINEGEKTAYQIAPYISWDLDCNSWEEFPPAQKWFAMGETIAHLKLLESEGRARAETRGDQIVFLPA
jgi:glyoxylase-like metal-dependent hydrolase (beta-lactamase superfamily II)